VHQLEIKVLDVHSSCVVSGQYVPGYTALI